MDSIGYLAPQANGDYHVVRKVIARNANGLAMTDIDGHISFGDLDGGGSDGIDGSAIILQKLDLVRTWLKQYYNINIDEMREEIQSRQYARNPDGSFQRDSKGDFVNNLTLMQEDGTNIISRLLMEVMQYSSEQ